LSPRCTFFSFNAANIIIISEKENQTLNEILFLTLIKQSF